MLVLKLVPKAAQDWKHSLDLYGRLQAPSHRDCASLVMYEAGLRRPLPRQIETQVVRPGVASAKSLLSKGEV